MIKLYTRIYSLNIKFSENSVYFSTINTMGTKYLYFISENEI